MKVMARFLPPISVAREMASCAVGRLWISFAAIAAAVSRVPLPRGFNGFGLFDRWRRHRPPDRTARAWPGCRGPLPAVASRAVSPGCRSAYSC